MTDNEACSKELHSAVKRTTLEDRKMTGEWTSSLELIRDYSIDCLKFEKGTGMGGRTLVALAVRLILMGSC